MSVEVILWTLGHQFVTNRGHYGHESVTGAAQTWSMDVGGKMLVRVLGSIEVVADEPVVLAPQLRRLLGLLVVANGDVVSAHRIAEYVAEGGDHAGSAVRTAVSRLRKVLGERIVSGDGGYRLVLTDGELDAHVFEQCRVEAAEADDLDDRVEGLRRALDVWRGRAFGEVGDEEWAAAAAARLDTARAETAEDLADVLVASGRGGAAIELLEAHVVDHPYRERPVALLMRALDDTGRRADALRTYQRFRTMLADETGLDPSPDLAALETDLLTKSPASGGNSPGPDTTAPDRLPGGTVTFVFTDVEGSTERWQADESAMATALADHDRILREAIEAHGGAVFKHTGDGMCAVFTSAMKAVAAAVAAQRHLDLPVRMGVHTGEADQRNDDYFGSTLNRVARIMDAGHGGQVLLSSATAALVADVEVTDLGNHRLRGLSTPERIFQVGTTEFAHLRVADARKGNLPAEMTTFIGRSEQVEELLTRLVHERVVTLLGVGGTGKTRLAIATARRLAPAFPDGTWMVELARVAEPGAVAFSIAAALGIAAPEGGDVLDHVIGRIRHQRLLLIVDNCEHLLEASADAIERIVAGCPTATVLATSREPLLVAGEQLVPIPPLGADDAERLFIERAAAEAPQLELDDDQLAAIREVCERLDRLPLPIELAAARLRSMTPTEILARLDERFRLLVGGRRSRMERHQTMRGTLDWSYDLCGATERVVFDRLAVFPAEFDLEAAAAVAGDDTIDEFEVHDTVARLVDRSLVQRVTRSDGTSSFRLLETMRAYGREHLRDQGEPDAIRQRHAHHFAATIAALSLQTYGPREHQVNQRLRELAPDALVAIDWLIDRHDWERAIRVAMVGRTAAWRIMLELLHLMRRAVLEVEGTLDGLEPSTKLTLLTYEVGDDGQFVWNSEKDAERTAVQMVVERSPVPHDVLVIAPQIGARFLLSDGVTLDEWFESLDQLKQHPLIIRFQALHWVVDGVMQTDAEVPPDRWADLAALATALDSEAGFRRLHGSLALREHLRGDHAAAFYQAELAISTVVDEPSVFDISAACRLLSSLVEAGQPLTVEHVSRPWDWIERSGMAIPKWNAVVSTLLAIRSIDRPDLTDRLMAWLKADIPAEEFPRIFHDRLDRGGLSDRFNATDANHDDDLGAIVDEIVAAVADAERNERT